MAKAWDLFNPFQPSRAAERTRLQRERDRQALSDIALQGELARQREEEARRKEAAEKALLELRRGPIGTAIEGALPASAPGRIGVMKNPVPVDPFYKKPLMSNDEWLALPRERQMEIFAENEGERWELKRRQAEQHRPTKFSPERARDYAVNSVLDTLGGLQSDAKEATRVPWIEMLKKDPNLVMRNTKASTGIRKEAAAEHAYKFRTDPEYRKKIWAMPKDLLNPAEVPYDRPKGLGEALGDVYPGLTSERARPAVPWVSRPTFGTEKDVRRELRSETLTKPVAGVASLYTGKERKDQHEIAQRIANGTATDEDYWRHGHYEARVRIASEKGLLGKTADQILDMTAYMTEFGIGWSLLGKGTAQATKAGFAKIFAKKAPGYAGQKAVDAASLLVGHIGTTLARPQSVWTTMQEQLPGLNLRRDEEDRLIAYMGKDARTAGRKFFDAVVKVYTESVVESLGGTLVAPFVRGKQGILALARKMGGKNVSPTVAHNTGLALIKKTLTVPRTGGVLRKAGFHGFIPEMAEEEAQGFVDQFINPEHFLTTNQANVWTKTRDFVTGATDERGKPKVTAKELGDELIPMALAFLVVGTGGKMMSPQFWKSEDFPEPNKFALEPEGPWKDLLLKEGKEKSDTMVEALEQILVDSVERRGGVQEVNDSIEAIVALAKQEATAPSDQNISRSAFEEIKLPGSEKTLYDMLKKQEDRKGFLDGFIERLPRMESVMESASEAMFERAQAIAGRPVHLRGAEAAAIGPEGEPLSAVGEPSLGPRRFLDLEDVTTTFAPEAPAPAAEVPTEVPTEVPADIPAGMPLEETKVSGVTVGELLEGVEEEAAEAPILSGKVVNQSTAEMLRAAADAAYEADKDEKPKQAAGRRNALQKAADAIEGLDQDVRSIEDLQSIAGIGKGSAERIKSHLAGLEPLAPAVEAATPEVAAPAVKPSEAAPLYEEFGIPENPTFAQMLGVEEGETDIDLINKRHLDLHERVKLLSLGPQAEQSETLLNELMDSRLKMIKAAEETAAKRGEQKVVYRAPVKVERGDQLVEKEVAEPTVPVKGAAALVDPSPVTLVSSAGKKGETLGVEVVSPELRVVAPMVGLFNETLRSNANEGPITEFYRKSTPGAIRFGRGRWVKNLQEGFPNNPAAKKAFDAIWDSPEDFFKDYHTTLETLRGMDLGDKASFQTKKGQEKLKRALMAAAISSDQGLMTLRDAERTGGYQHLSRMEAFLEQKEFKDAYEKAIAEAPAVKKVEPSVEEPTVEVDEPERGVPGEVQPPPLPGKVQPPPLEPAPTAAVKKIADEERKDFGPSLVEPGEQLPPGSTTNTFTPEKEQTPEEKQKQKKTYEDEHHEALAANPHPTVFVEDKKPTISQMVNGIAKWHKPELKGEELKAWRKEVRGYVDEVNELLNDKYNLLHTDIPGEVYTKETWKRMIAEAKRLSYLGKKRVKDDRGKLIIKDADYSLLHLDEFAQAIRDNDALRAMVGEVVGDTSNEESAAYELLIADIPHVSIASAETEEATLEFMERSGHTPSWAPEEPESMDRFELGLKDKIVAGIPNTEGLEEGETVPPVVHGKVVEESEGSVWVETSDGAQYEVDRSNLQTFFGESGEEFDFYGENMGLFSFTPGMMVIPAYFAVKRLHDWVKASKGEVRVQYYADRFKDFTKVGGQYGKEMWQELQDSEAYVRKVTQDIQYRLADLDVAIKQSPWKRRLPLFGLRPTKIEKLSVEQEDLLNRALEVRPEKLAKWAEENKLPERLVGPIMAISKINVELSKEVAKQLPEIMKDPDFVKNYDYRDLVRTWVSSDSVHLVRVYRAFDDPGWGARIKREHPELVEQFRRGIAGSLRKEAIEKESTKLFKKGRQDLLKDPHYKGLLAKLRELKKKKKDQQTLLFESNSEKDLMSSLTEILEPLKDASVKEATKTVDRRTKAGEILTEEGLNGWVESYLSPNRVEPRVKKALGQTDMRILMSRVLEDKKFHEVVKKVLGEYTTPAMRVIRSAELLSSFIANRKMQRRLAKEGLERGWFIDPPADELEALTSTPLEVKTGKFLHYNKVIPNKIAYGALAGLRTTEQFWKSMERYFGREGVVDGNLATSYRYWMGAVATAKGSKTIMNWSTQSMNAITNKMISIVHGDISLNPLKIPSTVMSMWEAFGQVWRSAKKTETYSLSRARGKLENAKTPEAKAKWQKVVDKKAAVFEEKYRKTVLGRIERGVYFDSPIRELEDMVKEAAGSDASLFTHVPEAFDQDLGIFKKSIRLLKRGVTSYWKAHANVYRMGDDFYKGLADSATIKMLDKAYPPHDPRWKGMTSEQRRDEIMKEAGLRVRDRYPTSSLSPEAVQLLRRLPLVATFPTWISEFIRTQYVEFLHKDGWMRKDLTSGNPTLRNHAVGTYIRWLGANYGVSEALALIIETVMSLVPGGGPEPLKDDQLIEDLTEGTPPWDRHKFLQWFMVRGKDGKPEYYYNNISRINPYGRIQDATKAFLSSEDPVDNLRSGADILIGELLSVEMVLARVFAVLAGPGGEKPGGGDVYNPESANKWGQALNYIWQIFKPGEWESLRRLGGISPWKMPHLFGPAGDYFRGWGEADKAGREYNTVVEFLSLITPRIGHLKNPKISFDVRASVIAEKMTRINSDIWKSGTNKGWNAEKMFEDSLVNANKRWNLHLQSVGRLVRFGLATGLSRKEMKESIQKKLSRGGVSMKEAKRIVNQAANNETIRIPYEISDAQKDALGPVQRKKYNSDTWRAKKLPFESPIRGLKRLK